MDPSRLINLDGTLSATTQSGSPDPYNNPTDQTATSAVKCWFEQLTATEDTAGTAQETETHRLFFRSGATVSGFDTLTVSGHTFAIVGPPWNATHPRTGAVTHVEAKGRQVR